MSWLPTVLHLLQGDPKHSGRAEGVAEGSREALPHRLHSLAASVRLQTKMARTRSRTRHLPVQARYHGWGADSNNKLRTTRTKRKRDLSHHGSLSCVSSEMRRLERTQVERLPRAKDGTAVRCGTPILMMVAGGCHLVQHAITNHTATAHKLLMS